MSDVVEKTLSALPSLLSLDSQAGAGKLSPSSKLGNLIKGITELTSKHEEETLIKKELESIKEQVASPNTTMRQMKEIMVRAIYCEMLGYQASFSYIHAIKLAQQGSVLEKRVGYLAVSLFLNETDEFLLLLVNTVLKDLQSTNLIEVCMALTVVSQMFPKDMIPAILPVVEEKLTHPKEIIRRKAVLALYKFYLIAPNQVQHIHSKFRKALCDKDPGVMTASLHIYLQLIKENPESYKDLTGSMVTILRQVVGGKLPLDFNYHSVPAPWLQIQLLRILAYLGKEDQGTSEMMYDVLEESLRRAEMNHNITYAILFECVKTIYTVHPKSQLLEKAAECIGNFVLSPKINLKYLGLKALTYVVQQDANLALPHQMTIIECLDHSDVIIKRETLELLFRITNAQNVTVIVEKMLEFLRLTYNVWFIQTMNSVFSLGGDVMQPDIPNNFLRLLAEGVDNVEDRQLRLFAVDSYVSLLQGETAKLPQRFLQVISWVLGEYSYLREEESDPGSVMRLLARLLDQRHTSTETRSWVLGAMTKLCSSPVYTAIYWQNLHCYSTERHWLYKTKCLSSLFKLYLTTLIFEVDLIISCLSWLWCCFIPQVDSSLSFLDGYVSDALAAGAAPYKSPHQRQEDLVQEKALSLEPYGLSLPVSLSSCSITDRRSPTLLSMSSGLSGNSTELSHQEGSTTLKLEGVKRVWGKDGYLAQQQSAGETPTPLVELPSPLLSPQSPPSQKPSSGLEPDQEKRQLASSLFVGLGSHNSVCLVRLPSTVWLFIKNCQSANQSNVVKSLFKPFYINSCQSALHNLLDSTTVASEGGAATTTTPQQTSQRTLDHTTSNGNPHVEGTEQRVEAGGPLSLIRGNGMVAVVPPRDLPLTSHLPAELSGLARSEFTPLCSDQDSSLALSACRVYKEDALVLLVFISNNNDSALHQMVLQLTCKELEVYIFQTGLNNKVPLFFSEIPVGRSRNQDRNTRVSSNRDLEKPRIFCESFRNFCSPPLTVSTGDYGKMWLSFSHDLKQNLRLVTTEHQEPLTATLDALKGKLHLHVVDIIGSEGIVACRLLQGPGQGQPCLLHCRVHADSLAVWLRSPVPELPDSLLYHCQKALTET
uniref:AP-4 complex subunit epsilon n=1 Tax=Oncorhynchus kisutch TaxID=8019 RepID=A0A8C7HGC1_ONCKI